MTQITKKLLKDLTILSTMLGLNDVPTGELFVAGGCIRDSICYRDHKDIDLYCTNTETFNKIKNYLERNFDNTSSSSFADTYMINGVSTPVQLIKNIGSPEYVVSTFDFNVNTNYLILSENYSKEFPVISTLVPQETAMTSETLLGRMDMLLSKGYGITPENLRKVFDLVHKKVAHKDYINHKDLNVKVY